MAQSTPALYEQSLQEVTHLYEIEQDSVVASYLRAHPALLDLLPEAAREIRTRFGAETPLALELTYDPEDEGYEKLFVLIRTPLPVDEALARLSKLDRGWWLDSLARSEYKLNIDVE